jgi:hypothetical protein
MQAHILDTGVVCEVTPQGYALAQAALDVASHEAYVRRPVRTDGFFRTMSDVAYHAFVVWKVRRLSARLSSISEVGASGFALLPPDVVLRSARLIKEYVGPKECACFVSSALYSKGVPVCTARQYLYLLLSDAYAALGDGENRDRAYDSAKAVRMELDSPKTPRRFGPPALLVVADNNRAPFSVA